MFAGSVVCRELRADFSMAVTPRRFQPPWSVDDPDMKLGQDCYVVRDANGRALAYVYFVPTNLLLKCEVKVKMTSSFDSRPHFQESKFEVTLRLKEGELSEPDSGRSTAEGCVFLNNIISCSAKRVEPSFEGGSIRSESTTYISRETGEYNQFTKALYFTASGKQEGSTNLHRSGTCRTVGKPIL
jgi:hypothetical protein